MRARERLGLANLAYQRAIAGVRAESTPARWARLLTAARNLRIAREDRAREETRAPGRAATLHGRGESAVLAFPAVRPRRATAPDVAADWDRARELREWSRRLHEESRALHAAMAALASEALRHRGGG